MARPTLYNPKNKGKRYLHPESQPQFINGADLDNVTLKAGEWITIWSDTVAADTRLFWGYGPRNREASDASFSYAQLLASGAGTSTDGTQISGKVRLAIKDSTGDDIRRRIYGDLDDLADAETESRTERPMMPELQPAAKEDKRLALQVQVAPGQDGVEVASDSNVQLHYGLFTGA